MTTNPIIDSNGTQEWRNGDGEYHREDGPAVIHADGSHQWWVNGKRHRIDGPAVIYADGTQEWYVNGQCHRTDGPAIIWADGIQAWYVNGQRIKSIKEYRSAANLSDEEMTMFVLKYGNIS